jgi:hypothetical protein
MLLGRFATLETGGSLLAMPDKATSGARAGRKARLACPDLVGPTWRAAPTRLANSGSGHGWSRRWLIVVAIVVAGLLAGAAVALTAPGSGSPASAGSVSSVGRPWV